MDPGILTGGTVALGAFLAGQWLPRPHRRGIKRPKPVQPVCGCRHHHSFHDPKTGVCGASVPVPTKWDAYGNERAWRQDPCACRQYSGPQPLPEVYAPEISS